MNTKYLFICFLINFTFAQVGVGTTTPNGALEVNSTTQGLVMPRVSLTASNVASPVVNPNGGALLTGTMVYNTATAGSSPNNVIPGFYFWDGSKWVLITSQVSTTNPDWSITGNAGTTAGTNFIGTTDAVDFVAKTNNTERVRVKTTGEVGIGTTSPLAKFQVNNGASNVNGIAVRAGADWDAISFAHNGTTAFLNAGGAEEGIAFRTNASATGNYLTNTYTEQMRIAINGNVGIGVVSPSEKLDVNGKTKTATFQMTTGAGANKVLQSDASGNAIWTDQNVVAAANEPWYGTDDNLGATTNTENIYQMGNVGIGNANPTSKLHTKQTTANGSIFKAEGLQSDLELVDMDANNIPASLSSLATQSGILMKTPSSRNLVMQIRNNDVTDGFHIVNNAGTHVATFSANARTGILTTTPVLPLDVKGGSVFGTQRTGLLGLNSNIANFISPTQMTTNAVTTSEAALRITRAGTSGVVWNQSAEFRIGSFASNFTDAKTQLDVVLGDGVIGTPNRSIMTMQSEGKVGIGTTLPTDMLTVVDATNANQFTGTLGVMANNLTQGISLGYAGISKVSTAATSDLFIDSKSTGNILLNASAGTGRVGIGTPSPVRKLEINSGALGTPSIRLTQQQADLAATSTSGDGTKSLVVDNNGDVVTKINEKRYFPSNCSCTGAFPYTLPADLTTYEQADGNWSGNGIGNTTLADFILPTPASAIAAGHKYGDIVVITRNSSYNVVMGTTNTNLSSNLLLAGGTSVGFVLTNQRWYRVF